MMKVQNIPSRRERQSSPMPPPADPAGAAAAPSVPAALEKLASATHRVIAKRIDLVMLENEELISQLLIKASFLAFGVVAGLAAWFTALRAVVPYMLPGRDYRLQLLLFAAVNLVLALIVIPIVVTRPRRKLASEHEGNVTHQPVSGDNAAFTARDTR
ncbi:MAG TPA: hypothetical protein VGK20_08760 [Candidatus Binatia bacterium]|jgi:uncharacterized membrane protein YqjE